MSQNNMKKVVVLGTGGTIAGVASASSDNVGYTAAQIGIRALLVAVPALAQLPCELLAEQVAQLDSKDMSFTVWHKLLNRTAFWLADPQVQGIVITHGTDTLEETAYFLHCALPRHLLATKPVALTCAMRPASALNADGPQNLRDALSVALTPGAKGVVAVCAGTVHTATEVQKIHPYWLDAFNSGDAGPLAYVEEGVVRLLKDWPVETKAIAQRTPKNISNKTVWPRVEIVMNYAGADGWMVEALLAQSASGQGAPLRGIVVAGTGNGTLHIDLEAALLKAHAGAVAVRRSTRCPSGRVIPVPDAAIKHSEGLSPVKARVALMLELMTLD